MQTKIYSYLLYCFLSNTTELGESEKGKIAINYCIKCDSVKGQHYMSQVCCRKWKWFYITYLEELKFVKSNLLKLVRTHRLKQHTQVCTRSSVCILMYDFQFSFFFFHETLECVDERTSDSCAFSFCFFVLYNFIEIVFDLSYYFLNFVKFYYYLLACSFLMRGRKGGGKDGRERWEKLQGREEGETTMRMYCVRKESIFSKRKKSNLLNISFVRFEYKYCIGFKVTIFEQNLYNL